MPKKNDLICRNIFKNEDGRERKRIFTQRIAGLINQMEDSKPADINMESGSMRNDKRTGRPVPIESPMQKGGA